MIWTYKNDLIQLCKIENASKTKLASRMLLNSMWCKVIFYWEKCSNYRSVAYITQVSVHFPCRECIKKYPRKSLLLLSFFCSLPLSLLSLFNIYCIWTVHINLMWIASPSVLEDSSVLILISRIPGPHKYTQEKKIGSMIRCSGMHLLIF